MTQDLIAGEFKTPKGNPIKLCYRPDTFDYAVIVQTLEHDEYGLAALDLQGWAFDLGGYIGSVSVALAIDNPGLKVLAVEPIPENWKLIERNAELNGVADRVKIVNGAVGLSKTMVPQKAKISYNTNAPSGKVGIQSDSEVGNALKVDCFGMGELQWYADKQIPSFVKMDIEWGEYAVLSDPLFQHVPIIYGEYHPVKEGGQAVIQSLLGNTHDLTFLGEPDWYGTFNATQKENPMFDEPNCHVRPTLPDPETTWGRCMADTLDIAARRIACGDAAEVNGKPISKEYALDCIRQVQAELKARRAK